MARGSLAKEKIMNKILSTFDGSFLYNDGKELRIPIEENGEIVQIKIAMTAAKVNVESGADNATPGEETVSLVPVFASDSEVANIEVSSTLEPTEEEKENIRTLMANLGF